ncbi:MAG: hypothetical protein WKG00_24180 [Polyangiaceae bacterium]
MRVTNALLVGCMLFLAAACSATPEPPSDEREPPSRTSHRPLDGSGFTGRVTVLYLVPAGQEADGAKYWFMHDAMGVIRSFYAQAAGRTFEWTQDVLYANHPVDWFGCGPGGDYNYCAGRVDEQLIELGYPLWAAQTTFLVAMQGESEHYAAAMSPDTMGGVALVGADSFSQVIAAGCAPGTCAVGGADGDGVTGGIAHELGHAFGLPHPPDGIANRAFSLMAEHWHFPNNGFLPSELPTLAAHPLLACVSSGCGGSSGATGGSNGSGGATPPACEGVCGGQAAVGCWCDAECAGYGIAARMEAPARPAATAGQAVAPRPLPRRARAAATDRAQPAVGATPSAWNTETAALTAAPARCAVTADEWPESIPENHVKHHVEPASVHDRNRQPAPARRLRTSHGTQPTRTLRRRRVERQAIVR